MKIKICGLTCERDIEIVNNFLPDYAGFIFAESRRKLSPEQAKNLKNKLDFRIKSAGVFVNEKPERIAAIANEIGLYAVQLHGDEDEAHICKTASLTKAKIIKCVRTKDGESVMRGIDTEADFVLFDTYDANNRGGTGRSADWDLILRIRDKIEKPFFLAGGITPENARDTLIVNPYAIDVNSGVEAEKGGKDAEKVKALFEQLRLLGF